MKAVHTPRLILCALKANKNVKQAVGAEADQPGEQQPALQRDLPTLHPRLEGALPDALNDDQGADHFQYSQRHQP
jgi:hypothetical protein